MAVSLQERNNRAKTGEYDGDSGRLKQLVQRFRVCWETLPDYYYVKGQKRQIGFVLVLAGTHEAGVEHPEPGCEHCRNVRRALQAIAFSIIPKERRDSDYDVTPYDQAIHHDPNREFRPEVTLQIWIRHRSGFDRDVDACQVRCLEEMTRGLKELGARERNWGLSCT
jgi:hypothetical protein